MTIGQLVDRLQKMGPPDEEVLLVQGSGISFEVGVVAPGAYVDGKGSADSAVLIYHGDRKE